MSGAIVESVFSGIIQLKYRIIRRNAAPVAAARYLRRKKPPRHRQTMPTGGNTTRSAIKRYKRFFSSCTILGEETFLEYEPLLRPGWGRVRSKVFPRFPAPFGAVLALVLSIMRSAL